VCSHTKVDKNHYLGGASAPKDAVMRAVMQYVPRTSKTWEVPSSVVQVTVEKDSWPAMLPSAYTPSDMRVSEYFKKGTQPTEVSQRFEKSRRLC
jgi:penicillin-binding protein 1A